MRWRPRLLAVVAAVLLGVSGCTASVQPPPPVQVPVPSPTPVTADRLAELKAAAGIADCPRSDPEVAPVANGLPDLTVACLGGGRPVRLAGLRGQPMVINVWAQWCGPCRQEAPYLAEVASDPDAPVRIFGIDYDDPEPDWAIEFARLSGWRFPQLADPKRKLAGPLRLGGGPPQTLFVTAEGRIAHRHLGPFDSAGELRTLATRHLGVRW